MDRADDRGRQAATRVHAAPRVTLDWQAVPFTCREKEKTKWIREKGGRMVLKSLDEHGKAKYWRAPRPRQRLHRRKRRTRKKEVMDNAMSNACPPKSLEEAHTAIQVLQDAVRASVARESKLQMTLQATKDKLRDFHDKARRHATELDRLVPQRSGDEQLQRNKDAESGFVGVTRNKGRWAAHTARSGGVREHLGTFDTPVEAARALQDRLAATVAATTEASPVEPPLLSSQTQWAQRLEEGATQAAATAKAIKWRQWIPNPAFCGFWSFVFAVIMSTGIPWYSVPISLILIYGLLLCMVDPQAYV